MKIISFAWTLPALLAFRKRCTRRHWDDAYAQSWHRGDFGAAYDRLPRAGGSQFGIVRLTDKPYLELTSKMPDSDYENEGLQWMEDKGILILGQKPREFWEDWKNMDEMVWVVRFDPVTVTSTTLNYSLWPELTSQVRDVAGAYLEGGRLIT